MDRVLRANRKFCNDCYVLQAFHAYFNRSHIDRYFALLPYVIGTSFTYVIVHTTGINAHIDEEYVHGEGKERARGGESYFRNKATIADQPLTAIRKVQGCANILARIYARACNACRMRLLLRVS